MYAQQKELITKLKQFPSKWGPVAYKADDTKTGLWRLERPVLTGECNGCAICVQYCPSGVISIVEAKSSVNLEYCKGCGICVEICPKKALEMIKEPQIEEATD
jgi:pyruvate ferredoxin oxidoreductase delta subunit